MEVDVTVSVLDTTVSVRWRGALAGTVPDGRRHWRTKVAYYQAVDELLATGETGPLAWQPIVDAVRPRGSRSTFYEVAGRHAKYPLVGALIQDGGMEAIQVALCYQRGSAVEQLIDEAKVWHYWRYRDRLVTRCRAERELSRPALAEAIVSAVTQWAAERPALAAALDSAPPICAVEDLLAARRGELAAQRAYTMLSQSIACARALPRRGPVPAVA